jgi:hypothetical protein
MKKHKLEFSIGALFIAFVVLLMWQNLSLMAKPLPIILVSLCVAALVFLSIPMGFKKEKIQTEAYAPKYFAQAILSSLIGMAIIVFVAVILNKTHFSKTFDLTTNKINSLSDESIKFLDSLDKTVQIICVPSANPTENYCDKSADLVTLFEKKSKFVVNIGRLSLADKMMLQRVQPSGFARLVLLTDNNKTEIDGEVTENRLTNAVINLVKFKKVVYFLSGHGEPALGAEGVGNGLEKNYADIVPMLRSKAYEVKEWNVKQGALPLDARVLVAGDNHLVYGQETETILKNFVGHGGRLILIVNPYREQGLSKFYEALHLKLDPVLLTLNTKSSIGQQIQKQSLARLPVIASNFNVESPITKVIAQVYGAQAIMPVDGGRPITVLNSDDKAPIKTTVKTLISAYSSAPITITPEARNKIDLMAPFLLHPDQNFDPNKAWPLAVSVEAHGVSALLSTKPEKPKEAAQDQSEIVIYGFSLVGPYSKALPISEELLPLTVAHLYQDQELVSIAPRDFTPKQFNLSRNPGLWLPLFAGILPLFTAIAGLLIWVRRRSA